ncbi:MAG: peptidylprolyl isomerase [Candidatus Limnocylindrales bacterium]
MTSNLRSRGGGAPQRRPLDPEERFQRRVTLGFIGLTIVAIVAVVLGLAWQYWDQHLKAVATVEGTSISRDQWADRARLEDFRLERQDRWVTEAAAAGELTAEQADTLKAAISNARESVTGTAIDSLIALTLQGKLAADRGITVTDADVDAAIAADAHKPETRRVSVIEVAPETDARTGASTSEDRQQALADAQAALAALEAGTPFADVAREHSTAEDAAAGGDRGFVGRDDTTLDPALLEAIFSVAAGEDTPLLQDADGTYLIAHVAETRPGAEDPTFTRDLQERISSGAYRDNMRLQALAQRLEDGVVADATTGDKPQAHLAEIWLDGDTTATDDSGRVHAAHILYQPEDGLVDPSEIPGTDPSWTVAQSQAGLTSAELKRITDPTTRADAFTELATQSDDTSNASEGGDLGWFDRGTMVAEFADPLFDNVATLQPGDIVGPVRSDFGWHVIQFLGYEPPLADRRTQLAEALAAPDADFAAIAAELSDGAEAATGGDLGWRLLASLPEEASTAISELQPDGVTEPIALEDGYHVYRLIERADRPLDPAQLATVSSSAFDDWYQPIQDEAEESGRITTDDSLFEGA